MPAPTPDPARYGPETYGDRWASIYDDLHGALDPAAAVERLAPMARDGRVLELGIGTGRIALPLAAHGIEVHGIDASEEMIARLRAKPGGDAIPVTIGDFAGVPVEGRFNLVFVAFNTFFALLTQEDQVRCFRNVAAHLAPEGVFVIEAFVPDPTRWTAGQRIGATHVDEAGARFEVSTHDPVRQHTTSQQIVIDEGGVRLYPVQVRYAYPAELDLMAQLAGLRLISRSGDWSGGPFTAASTAHVSVYGRE
jgi:SAM-dependent methyltransferase